MNHFSKLSILAVILASSFVFEASAATSTDCGYLGYKKEGTISCDPSDMIRCPADTSMVFCKTMEFKPGKCQTCEVSNGKCVALKSMSCDDCITISSNADSATALRGWGLGAGLLKGGNAQLPNSHRTYYVKGEVTVSGSQALFSNHIDFLDAADLPECQAEGVTPGKLIVSTPLSFSNGGLASFYVETKIDQLNVYNGQFDFYKNATVCQITSSNSSSSVVFTLQGSATAANFGFYCSASACPFTIVPYTTPTKYVLNANAGPQDLCVDDAGEGRANCQQMPLPSYLTSVGCSSSSIAY